MGICLSSSKNDEKFNEDGGEDPRFMQANIPDNEKESATAIDIVEDEPLMDGGTGGIANKTNAQKITMQDFEFIKVLGRGSFGKVMLVVYKQTQLLYAMKILRKDMVEKRNQRIHTKNERSILESVRHPFIVRLHSAFQTQQKLYLIMDFMIGGELFFHLRRAFRFNEDRSKFYSAEIILALEYLHKKGIVYRDLKPENILVGQDGHIKITDFGLSKTNLQQGEKTNTFCGTPEYLAPEILLGQGHNQLVDWWSLGALLYEMLAGAPPFYSKDKTMMFRNRLEKPIEMKPWFSQEAQSILRKLLNNDPTQRLGANGAEEIKTDPFFSGLDWNALYQKEIEPPFKPKVFNNRDLRHFDQMFTEEPVLDTPVNVSNNMQLQDTYEKFTFVKNLDNSQISDNSFIAQKSMMEKFVEVNPNFEISPKKQ